MSMNQIGWNQIFYSFDERILYIYSYDIPFKYFTFYSCCCATKEWIIHPSSFFCVSLNKMIRNLWNKISMVKIRVFPTFCSLINYPQTIHIEIYFFPILKIKIVMMRHKRVLYQDYLIEKNHYVMKKSQK